MISTTFRFFVFVFWASLASCILIFRKKPFSSRKASLPYKISDSSIPYIISVSVQLILKYQLSRNMFFQNLKTFRFCFKSLDQTKCRGFVHYTQTGRLRLQEISWKGIVNPKGEGVLKKPRRVAKVEFVEGLGDPKYLPWEILLLNTQTCRGPLAKQALKTSFNHSLILFSSAVRL